METIKLFIFQLVVILAMSVTGCSSVEEPLLSGDPADAKTYQVKIGFSGEITNIIESPLTKVGEAKDWYAFQVYSAPEDDPYGSYQAYAYGFFDNKSDMVINLKEGYKYKFDVSMVVDGSEKVEYFSLENAGWTSIGNSFFITSQERVRYMYEGYLYLQDPFETFDRPNVDRFFGSTKGYVPTQGGSVNIDMKRVSFGVKFVAKNFMEGSLELSVEGAPILSLDASSGTEIQDIISFNYLSSAFSEDNYTEEIPVNIVWVKPDNVRVPIASESIAFKRNKLTTIEFTVDENTTSNSFELKADEEMETGDTFEVGGDGTDTGVNPTK